MRWTPAKAACLARLIFFFAPDAIASMRGLLSSILGFLCDSVAQVFQSPIELQAELHGPRIGLDIRNLTELATKLVNQVRRTIRIGW